MKKWGNKCAVCGKVSPLHSAHIFSRKNKTVRWDLENGIALCVKHHLYWAHKEPVEFVRFCEELLGKEKLDALGMKARQVGRMLDLDAIEQNLKSYLEDI